MRQVDCGTSDCGTPSRLNEQEIALRGWVLLLLIDRANWRGKIQVGP